jgi:hypothetical protein
VLSVDDLTKTSLLLKIMIDVRRESSSYEYDFKEKSLRRLDE